MSWPAGRCSNAISSIAWDFLKGDKVQFFRLSLFVFSLICSATGCAPAPVDTRDVEVEYFPPAEPMGGWRKNTEPAFIRSLGLDPELLEEFGRYNLSVPNSQWMPYARYKGIMVIKNGWIVGEWYNVPEAATFRTYISSNGKSFAMACFGIMAEDSRTGKIEPAIDEQSKVYDRQWLPEGFPLSDPLKKQIAFEQIFRHTSGLCPERSSSGEEVEQGRNEWTDYADWVVGHDKNWPQTGKLYFTPGHPEEYETRDNWGMVSSAYSSVGFGHVGLVLSNIYGCPASDFLRERLLGPLGFSGIDYHAPQSDKIRWFSAGGLRMTPRDYARFAYLLLRDGRWDGEQLVPSSWIKRFRGSPHYPNLRSNIDGFFGKQYPEDMFRIAGSGLNWAFIVPSLDIIVLRTGRAHNEVWEEVREKFLQKIFAAVVDRNPENDV
jgi:Beta-lactamase